MADAVSPPRPFLAGYDLEELTKWVLSAGGSAFRTKQISGYLYNRMTPDPQAMKTLPSPLRDRLSADFLAPGVTEKERTASPDGTTKLLLELYDGEQIEMVLIPDGGAEARLTFCLSTQVGCPVGCRFCASGRHGLTRNLFAGEILGEFLAGCAVAGRKPDNIVFMGIGEGLLNFTELSRSLAVLTSPDGYAMSPRRITVSTSGYVPGIDLLASLKREYTLAISLHAVTDELRTRLIPGMRYSIDEILAAADRYRETAGRMVTLEYVLLSGVNDSEKEAETLGRLASGHHAKINLIPYNATGSEFSRPAKERIRAFARRAASTGVAVTIRAEHGTGSVAACGQLRSERKTEKSGKESL